MKDIIIDKSLSHLNNVYQYDTDTYDRVKYGLETIYISITKLIVVLSISLIFGVIKETLLTILFINGLRKFAYGMHAKKSWHCYVESTIVFVLFPYIFSKLIFDINQKIIISIICFLGYCIFAPADTHKRPLINKNHRKQLKIYTLIVCIAYISIIFISKNTLINNMIILSMISECFLINPIIYKLFSMPYNNYMTYNSN